MVGTAGKGFMVIALVTVNVDVQLFASLTVSVTSYVPGMLFLISTAPVLAFANTNPVVEENVDVWPVPGNAGVGTGFVGFGLFGNGWQYEVGEYAKVADGKAKPFPDKIVLGELLGNVVFITAIVEL